MRKAAIFGVTALLLLGVAATVWSSGVPNSSWTT
jgi:hypothetical protein